MRQVAHLSPRTTYSHITVTDTMLASEKYGVNIFPKNITPSRYLLFLLDLMLSSTPYRPLLKKAYENKNTVFISSLTLSR